MSEEPPYLEQFHTSGVGFMHDLPRFGRGSDISKLASSNQTEQADYIIGLFAVSFFLISVLIMWGVSMIACRCMGNRRIGFWAGRATVIADEDGKFKPPSYVWKLRCTFMSLGVLIILCSLALVGPGIESVQNISTATRKLNRDVTDLLTQGLLIIDSLSRVQRNIDALDLESTLHVEDACPNMANNAFLNDETLQSSLQVVKKEFSELKEYLDGADIDEIRDDIDYFLENTAYVDNAVTATEKNDWTARMFALVLDGLALFMILSSCLALCGKSFPPLRFMLVVFVLPLFTLVIIGSWIATSIIAVIAISNADFCSGGSEGTAEGTVMGIFDERGIQSDSMVYVAFEYFQSGCMTRDPLEHMYIYEDYIQSGIGSAHTFIAEANDIGIHHISTKCGADVSPIIEGIGLLKDNLGILLSALRSSFEVASCSKMGPIYRQAFDGAICTDSVGGLIMIFTIMLAISAIGMVMILLRSALFPCKIIYQSSAEEEEDDEWEEYQAYLTYVADWLTIWGDSSEQTDTSEKKGSDGSNTTSETSSASSDSTPGAFIQTNGYFTDDRLAEEQLPLSPNASSSQGYYHNAQKTDDLLVNGEPEPLSPDQNTIRSPKAFQTPCHSVLYPLEAIDCDDGESDECQPLSPHTPMIELNRKSRHLRTGEKSTKIISEGRFKTPDFLSPGTFKRWRRHDDDESVTSECQMPMSLNSPTDGSTGYFTKSITKGSSLTPLRRDSSGCESPMHNSHNIT